MTVRGSGERGALGLRSVHLSLTENSVKNESNVCTLNFYVTVDTSGVGCAAILRSPTMPLQAYLISTEQMPCAVCPNV